MLLEALIEEQTVIALSELFADVWPDCGELLRGTSDQSRQSQRLEGFESRTWTVNDMTEREGRR